MYEHIKLKPIRLLLNLYKYRESRKDLNDSMVVYLNHLRLMCTLN